MAKMSVGLDIGFSTIKVVALNKDQKQPELVSLGSIATPVPGMVSDGDVDLEVVSQTIKKLLEATKINEKEVSAALPESKVYTRVIDDLPFLKDAELASAIRYSAEEFIPMPVAEVELNWQILYRSNAGDKNGKTIVFVIATPRALVSKYLKVFTQAGLTPTSLETEIIAVTRSLVGNNPLSPTTLIIQMGAITTDMAVVSKGLILLTRSVSTGGLALTRAISQYFNFELAQAEEYKKTYGFAKNQLEGKVYEALKPVVDVIVAEIRRVVQSYEAKYPTDQIKRIVLSGGGAKLPGLVIFLANNLGLEVQEADPWYFIGKDKNLSTKLAADAPKYSVAVGLALRED